MKVHKTTFTVTVLHTTSIDGMTLRDVLDECDHGDMIGHIQKDSLVPIPSERLYKELLALGNDGTFFGDIEETDNAPTD